MYIDCESYICSKTCKKKDDFFKIVYLKAVFNEIIKTVSLMRGPLKGQTFLSYFCVPNIGQGSLHRTVTLKFSSLPSDCVGFNLVYNYYVPDWGALQKCALFQHFVTA